MGFSRQEYWSELPFPFSGDLPNPGSSQRRNQTQVSPIAGRLFGSSHQEADRILASRILRQSRGSATMQDLWPTERPIGNLPGGSDGQESACQVGDLGSIPGSGRSPGEGNGYSLQYSCLGNPVDRGAWWATIHGVAKSQT